MVDLHEAVISEALSQIQNGFRSIRAAADHYNIPKSTLHERLYGHTTHQAGHANQQRLTPEQENWLVD